MRTKTLRHINKLLFFLIGLLGFTGCEQYQVKYGVIEPDVRIDTSAHPMYGVPTPAPIDEVDDTHTH